MRCRMNLVADPVNITAPQFVDLRLLTINTLDKSASLWTPTTRLGMRTDATHGIMLDHIVEKVTVVREKVSKK